MVEQIPHKEALNIIDEIQKTPTITQRSLSKQLGISLGKTNCLIKALTKRGLIKLQKFKNSHRKLGYLYILTPEGIRQKTKIAKRFLNLKLQEYERLKLEIEQLKKEGTG